MSLKVLQNVANFVEEQNSERPVAIIWHGGEPLATGIKKLRAMLQPFEELRKAGKVRHHIQTNATLINSDWCDLFLEYEFRVGVSLDGPQWANQARVNWAGAEAFEKILSGIELLKQRDIQFSIIAVVGKETIGQPKELFDFFFNLGCKQLAINIEEQEGIHEKVDEISQSAVVNFWKELFLVWKQNPSMDIREFRQFLSFAYMTIDSRASYWTQNVMSDYLPTIAYNGDVYLLSPELAGMKSEQYGDFITGNVLTESLASILLRSGTISYVIDYLEGVNHCQQECRFFEYCGGGQASNKWFENGDLTSTQTQFCLNSKQLLVEGITQALRGD